MSPFVTFHNPVTHQPFRVDAADIAAAFPTTIEQRPANSRIDRMSQPVSYFCLETWTECLERLGLDVTDEDRSFAVPHGTNGKIAIPEKLFSQTRGRSD